MPAADHATPDTPAWNLTAALAAWVLPGLGHALLGDVRRGLVIGLAIATLWIGGLAIGGVGTIQRERHPFWFLGQALVAPSLAIHYVRNTFLVEAPSPEDLGKNLPGRVIYTPAYGHTSEQGVLYTALAGLLNLLAIIDVVYRPTRGNATANPGGHPTRDADAAHTRGGGA